MTGLSLALGAFLGGIVIADTEYGHRAMGDMLPLRDIFVSLFFVSLGMLADVRSLYTHPMIVVLALCGFVFLKIIVATIAALVMRFPVRVALLAGIGLAQFGELGYVLMQQANAVHIVEPYMQSAIMTAGIISMLTTPLLIRLAPHITAGERLLGPLEKLLNVRSIDEDDDGARRRSRHVVLVGFGPAGQLVARALRDAGTDYLALELNAATVRASRAQNEAVFYGDATSDEALRHAHLDSAAALIILINDSRAAERVLVAAKRLAPKLWVVMRTRYLSEYDRLRALGADEVVVEEIEGGFEAVRLLAEALGLTPDSMTDRADEARDSMLEMPVKI
jgi:CPA2 family monovalent cation:H+ antiporter-2